jgi:CubicO group peptidase (beta-lactamase class C family)
MRSNAAFSSGMTERRPSCTRGMSLRDGSALILDKGTGLLSCQKITGRNLLTHSAGLPGAELSPCVRRHIFTQMGMKGTAHTTAALAGAPQVVTTERLAATESLADANGLKMDGFVVYRTDTFAHPQPFDILPAWSRSCCGMREALQERRGRLSGTVRSSARFSPRSGRAREWTRVPG